MSEMPHYGIVTIDDPTLRSTQRDVKNIKDYEFSGRTGISLPRYGSRVGPRIDLFEACSAFTRVAACTLALSPYFVTRFTRRLQPFRCLHDCSGCFRLERLPGGACTHWKSAALSRRTPKADVRLSLPGY
jgi:hypothetical protein